MSDATADQSLESWREEELAAERHGNVWRTENYLIPLIRSLFPDRDPASVRILSVGCGNGEDVETVNNQGYTAFGVDTGYRGREWERHKHKDRFKVADAEELPFPDGEFDLVLSFGVIEHIGAIGDSLKLKPDFMSHRKRYAEQIARVTKPGGHILITTPNRAFPFDLWHGPFILGVRPHSPWENFLSSAGQIKSLFMGTGLCSEARLLGLDGFFQFKKSGKQLWIRLLLPVIRQGVSFISRFQALLASCLNPFLVVLIRRKPAV